jgi:hypothetical protein
MPRLYDSTALQQSRGMQALKKTGSVPPSFLHALASIKKNNHTPQHEFISENKRKVKRKRVRRRGDVQMDCDAS